MSKPPYLGAAYYPEDWPLEQIDEDIALMKEAGCNVMRIAEFAWSRMEPHEGEYDFDWLHLVVDKLKTAGIAVIMGTPTCTPPAWLVNKHPEILVMDDHGLRTQHGARRHACPNSPIYREYVERIVTKLADEFGDDAGVIGWQIDNELYPSGPRGCCCPVCHSKFLESLEARFGTIEALNEAWCTNLWSQTYESFEQIPVPRHDVWHHPSLIQAWRLFQSDSYADFATFQARLLHQRVKQPVGTDMMPFGGLSYYDTHRDLDLVQYNHYDSMEGLWRQVFWMDYVRPIKPVPFWNTETQTNWNGSTAAYGYREPGFCRANSWLPIVQGGEANLYWLWRAHWAGQELMHGSVVTSCGRPVHVFGEVQEIAAGFAKAGEFLRTTRVKRPDLAVHFSTWAWIFFEQQPQVDGFKYLDSLLKYVYRPLFESGIRADVLDPRVDLSAYKYLISPFLPALDEGDLRPRLLEWLKAGGTWLVTPFCDNRTLEATKFTHSPFGSLEDWAQLYCKVQLPGTTRPFKFTWQEGQAAEGAFWYDAFEPRDATVEVLATYAEGPLEGLAAVTCTRVGKGKLYVMGTLLDQPDFLKLLQHAGLAAEVPVSPTVLAVPREGEGGEGLAAVELENQPGFVELARPAVDLLSGEKVEGKVPLAPYQVRVLRYL